jgi:hypothetical protein
MPRNNPFSGCLALLNLRGFLRDSSSGLAEVLLRGMSILLVSSEIGCNILGGTIVPVYPKIAGRALERQDRRV